VPLPEEVSALNDVRDQVNMFATADRFMWEMNQIPKYAERLAVRAVQCRDPY
jgi:hypothetical protein